MNLEKADLSLQKRNLIAKLFENLRPEEISETLTRMLEIYIQHAPCQKIDVANTASLINRLNIFFFNLDAIEKKHTDGLPVQVEDKIKCSHN